MKLHWVFWGFAAIAAFSMLAEFGERYAEYKARTPRFLPGVGS